MPLLAATDLHKTYTSGDARVSALAGVSFALEAGDFVALMGPSGCGKSTLLHLCGAMDRAVVRPASCSNGRDLATLGDDELTRVRREQVGFVFQFFNLLPTLTIGDNIALPCLLGRHEARPRRTRRARALADRVGIAHRLGHYPQQVSGGEMQRAAIARALVHQPALLVADEPTGNLDSENGANVLALLSELNREMGITILLATHAADVAGGRAARRSTCATAYRRALRRWEQCADAAVPAVHPAAPGCRSASGPRPPSSAWRSASRWSSRSSSPTRARCAASRRRSRRWPGGRPWKSSASAPALDETVLPSLGWLREYGGVSPVIEGDAALVALDGSDRVAPAAAHRGRAHPRRGHPPRPAVSRLSAARVGARRARQVRGAARRGRHDPAVPRDADQRARGGHHREARAPARATRSAARSG